MFVALHYKFVIIRHATMGNLKVVKVLSNKSNPLCLPLLMIQLR